MTGRAASGREPSGTSRRPAGSGSLERRYRLLLRWYPKWHRREHEDEMVAVLLCAARSGQRWPKLADAANLLWGAARIRGRYRRPASWDGDWRDTMAVLGVVMPLLILSMDLAIWAAQWFRPGFGYADWTLLLSMAFHLGVLSGSLVLPVLIALRLRRTAAVAATAWFLLYAGVGWLPHGGASWVTAVSTMQLYYALEAVALFAARGGIGKGKLTWRRSGGAAAAGLSLGVIAAAAAPIPAAPWLLAMAVLAGVVLLIMTGICLRSALGRRLLALITIPAYSGAMTVSGVVQDSTPPGRAASLLVLPLIALAGLAVFLLRRSPGRAGREDPPRDAPT